MKLVLALSVMACVWSVVINGHGITKRSPYTGNCGVQLTRGKGGGIYYVDTAKTQQGSYSPPIRAPAASNVFSSLTSTSNRNNYGGGAGRYPSSQYGGGGAYQSSMSSSSYNPPSASSSYGGSSYGSGSNYGTSGYDRNPNSGSYGSSSVSAQASGSGNRGYGQSGGNSYGSGYGGSSSSSAYGGGSGWNQNDRYDYEARFNEDVLAAHNIFRASHNAPPVTLDAQMSKKAQLWAEEMASSRAPLGYSPDAVEGIYGESHQVVNTAYPSGADVMDRWYDEVDNYDFKKPMIVKRPFNLRNSHFTAMVWYGTRRIGVGKATSPISGKSFIVVTYYPPGNNVDVLENNVFPARTA